MQQSANIHKVAIVGANGYSGRELARLLLCHPNVHLPAVFTRDPDWQLADELPESGASAVKSLQLGELENEAATIDTLFLATPHDVSMTIAAQYADTIPHIIDLSGAFRLAVDEYPSWYELGHSAPALLGKAQYGLSPWWQDKPAPSKNLIANPGCYATCVLMALLPLLQAKLIEKDHIIIDAKSGITGAGRKPKTNLLFTEIDQDFYPYKIAQHQHQPEISRHIKTLINIDADLTLITHLLPIKRGISASIYVNLVPELSGISDDRIETLLSLAYDKAYQDYPLIKYGSLNKLPQNFLSLKKVVGSCRTHVAFKVKNGKLFIFATIDNLLKGAASQAVENFNYIHGIPVATALQQQEGVL